VSLALAAAQEVLPTYGHRFAPKKFTQPQLAACMVLKTFLRQDYRGVCALLALSAQLRKALGLQCVPHYSTLAHFSKRVLSEEVLASLISEVVRRAGGPEKVALALDATGLETTSASAHFTARSGRKGRKYVKLTLSVTVGGMLVYGAAAGWGPTNDKTHAPSVLEQSIATAKGAGHDIERLLADAGYDAEWIHRFCREEHGIASWIPPVVHRKDGQVGGRWRQESLTHLPEDFGLRWHVESAISGLKRMFGSALRARKPAAQFCEVVLRALTWSIHR
jgi:hypothetical protein